LDGCFANTNSNFSQACQWEWWELSEMFFRDFSGRIGTAAQMRGWKVSDPMLKTWVHWWDDAKFGRTKCVSQRIELENALTVGYRLSTQHPKEECGKL
jgi:hypothetical protein